ncbi:helix-turn-helix transcriptional regulator [Oscillibacter sp.]|uniref:helix-turn-helix transcriptional regulator n=1 Tax=Oscillibacter sp. TaxID=1945593 RepID=UPI0028A725AC|nr:helix-turn-helix transcriptional regulator [Oscillibacter sp.]
MRGRKKLSPLGKIVDKALTDHEMTKSELADMVGTSPQYLSQILHGARAGDKYLPIIIAVLRLDPQKVEKAIAA